MRTDSGKVQLEEFVRKLSYPKHCVGCEGIDESVEDPKHHPSYEVTLRCNLRCVFCYSKVAEAKGAAPKPGYYGDMDPKAITISQFGEPFVAGSEEVARIIDSLREIFGDVRIDIQTNGCFDLSILDGRADIVMVSLSAGSRESYAKLTGVDAFERVVGNIRKASRFAYTVIRTVYLPGMNDIELESIARIAAEADELFLQPVSVYRESLKLMPDLDIERAASIAEFLRAAYRLSEIADVRIPGCMLLNIRRLLRNYDFEDILFIRRNVFGSVPLIRREWRFRL